MRIIGGKPWCSVEQLQEGEVHILDAEAVVAVSSTYYVPITPRGDRKFVDRGTLETILFLPGRKTNNKAVGQDQGDFNLIFPPISVDIYQEERVDVFFLNLLSLKLTAKAPENWLFWPQKEEACLPCSHHFLANITFREGFCFTKHKISRKRGLIVIFFKWVVQATN